MTTKLQVKDVRAAAAERWPEILQHYGLTEIQTDIRTRSTGTSCPICGGDDRYSFKNESDGSWACRSCSGGDGFALLMRMNSWTFPQALEKVSEVIFSSSSTPSIPVQCQHKQDKKLDADNAFKPMVSEWKNAHPWKQSKDQHQYASEKKLSNCLLEQCRLSNGWLYVPVRDIHGYYQTWQRFSPQPDNHSKHTRLFARGVSTKGGLLWWGDKSSKILIAESISSADAAYQLFGKPCMTVCSFSAGQVPFVAELIRKRYPKAGIYICTDNDEAGQIAVDKTLLTVMDCTVHTPPHEKDWSDELLNPRQS